MHPKQLVFERAHRLLRRVGLRVERDRAVRDCSRLLVLKSEEFRVRTVLDVGANTGQFAKDLRRAGYGGAIVSFEPLSLVHAALTTAASRDPHWHVTARMALGSSEGESEINISHNLVSSSLLQVKSRSIEAAPVSGFAGHEKVVVKTLDRVVQNETWQPPFALKLDTQGFELEVLKGAARTLSLTAIVLVEMSLVPLYRGGAALVDVYSHLEHSGYRCITLTQGFADYDKNEVLQVDGLFVRP